MGQSMRTASLKGEHDGFNRGGSDHTGSSPSAEAALQLASTPCALLGSLAAVAGAWSTQDPGGRSPGRSPPPPELAAAALLAASLVLEVLALRRRGRRQRAAAASALAAGGAGADATASDGSGGPEDGRSGDEPRAASLWRRLVGGHDVLLLLGPALAMGAFTALGAGLGGGAVRRLGIVPRTWSGLPGVVFGCFVHLSWAHFGWNALAFLSLGLVVLRTCPPTPLCRHGAVLSSSSGSGGGAAPGAADPGGEGRRRGLAGAAPFVVATAFIAISSGFCVWCLARPALHAGASGVVCGYAGLLLALTLRRRDVPLRPLLMVLGVAACYGSAVLARPTGARPPCAGGVCLRGRLSLYEACTSRTTSAEHHTFGFLSGLAFALLFCQPGARAAGAEVAGDHSAAARGDH